MAWDNDKSTAVDPNNPQTDEQLTADEWDNHVSEGHFPSDELNFGVDGNGDPVITDKQNGGQTVMRYDRSAGSWVVDALEAEKINNGSGGPVVRKNSETLADTDRVRVDPNIDRPDGLMILHVTNPTRTGFFWIGERGTTIVNSFDSSDFSTTKNNQTTFNVYIDSNVTYIENEQGSQVDFDWTIYFSGIEP